MWARGRNSTLEVSGHARQVTDLPAGGRPTRPLRALDEAAFPRYVMCGVYARSRLKLRKADPPLRIWLVVQGFTAATATELRFQRLSAAPRQGRGQPEPKIELAGPGLVLLGVLRCALCFLDRRGGMLFGALGYLLA